jgi:hypothetical protein
LTSKTTTSLILQLELLLIYLLSRKHFHIQSSMFTENLAIWFLALTIIYWFLNRQRALIIEATPPFMGTSMSSDSIRAKVPRPTRTDIFHVAFLLQQKLPPELVPPILDYAEYWLKSSVAIMQDMEVSDIRILGRRSDYITPAATYLSTTPIGEVPGECENGIALVGQHPVRKVVFTVESQDQGWSDYLQDHGTERGSWTWFEAVVREPDQSIYQDLLRAREETTYAQHWRDEAPEPPRGRRVCSNVHAGRRYRTKSVTWSVHDGDKEVEKWVAELKREQIVDLTVWAKYPGWRNRVRSARIEVYLAAVR